MKMQNTVQTTVMESKSRRVFQYAKRIALSGKSILAVAVMIGLLSIPLLTKAQESNEKRTLTGNWLLTVTRINPPPGLAPTFLSLQTYFEDGNVLGDSNTPGIRSTAHGNWERIGRQQFTRSNYIFLFDAAGNYAGTRVITARLRLSEDGSVFHANAEFRSFDPFGNPTNTGQSTEVGQRF